MLIKSHPRPGTFSFKLFDFFISSRIYRGGWSMFDFSGKPFSFIKQIVLLTSFMVLLSSLVLGNPVGIQQEVSIETALKEAYENYKDVKDGKNADYIPELAKVPSELFGIAVVTVEGAVYAIGDTDYSFAIESVSKPFTLALVMRELQNSKVIEERIDVEPTGLPFNSVLAVEILPARSVNPMVNAGAIAAVSLVPAKEGEDKFTKIIDFYKELSASELSVIENIYLSESDTDSGNKALAFLLQKYGRIYDDPLETVDVYTRQCSVGITVKQLAVMGATLANGGINPISGHVVMDKEYIPKVLAVMMMAGFYNESGYWAYNVGLPSKTGVGGGIVAVVPGIMAIAAFSPRLDEAGNSVRAMMAIKYICEKFDLNIFSVGK
jgi:glutaminase